MKLAMTGFAILWAASALGGQVGPQIADNIQCRLLSGVSVYRSGDSPDLRVEVVNLGKNEVVLPGSLDGSEYRWRYPHVFFTVSGPEGQIEHDLPGRCGNTDEPRPQDFVALGSMEVFDPYERTESRGFWSSNLLRTMILDRPGEYVFTFHYSTAAPDADARRGGPVCPDCPVSEEVQALLAQVTRVSLSCSVSVLVKE